MKKLESLKEFQLNNEMKDVTGGQYVVLQDFDQLVDIIEKCNVQLPVRKAVTGLDPLKAIKALRKGVDTVSCTESFYNLLNRGLFLVMDAHSREETQFYAGSENLDGIDTAFMRKRGKYLKYFFGGGCIANNYEIEGRIFAFPETLCPYYKKAAISRIIDVAY